MYVPKEGDVVRYTNTYVKALEKMFKLRHPYKNTPGKVTFVAPISFQRLSISIERPTPTGGIMLRSMFINEDGKKKGIQVFERAEEINTPEVSGTYCSCGGLTKKVAAGIGPQAEFYDYCTSCKKERK